MKFLILLIIFGINLIAAQSPPSIYCLYSGGISTYSCQLLIQNSDGFNGFTEINGTHFTGMTDSNVLSITEAFGISTNFPSIICQSFRNLRFISVQNIQIYEIGESSLYNCQNLLVINFARNNIHLIDPNSFTRNLALDQIILSNNFLTINNETLFNGQTQLTTLNLDNNPLRDLPENIFR